MIVDGYKSIKGKSSSASIYQKDAKNRFLPKAINGWEGLNDKKQKGYL
jgi:hypothetical protein